MGDENSILLDNAYKLHSQGRLEEAKSLYEELLNICPDNLDVMNLYAQLNVTLKDYDKAIDLFSKVYDAVKLDDIKLNIIKVYIYKQDYKTAEDMLQEMNPDNISVAKIKAYCSMQKKDYAGSVLNYKNLISIEPDNYLNYFNLSLCYNYLNDKKESLAMAVKAFELNSSDTDVLLHISYLYEMEQDRKNAIIFLKKVSELIVNESIYYRLGVLNRQEGDFYEAVNWFDKVLQINPENKDAMLNIAASYKFIDKDNCIQIYRDIQKIYPDDLNILFCIYNVYVEMLDFSNALKIAEELIGHDNKSSLYYAMAADAYLALYEYQKAIEYYNLALKYNPEDIGSKCSLAYSYSCIRDIKKAYEILSKLPKNKAVLQDLTILSLRNRDFNAAKEFYFEWHTEGHTLKEAEEQARSHFYKLKVGEKYGITEEFFAYFRSAISTDTFRRIEEFHQKLLKNQDFDNKTVVIFSGHGAGDFIMFSRYLKIFKQRAKKVILHVPDSLIRLFKYSFPDIDVVSMKEDIPADSYDYAGAEMCLGYYLKMDFSNIPFSSGYLSIPDELIIEKSKLDVLKTQKKKVGIFWQGNPTTLPNRSIKLKYFEPVINMDNIQIYSYQLSDVDFESSELKSKLPLIDLAPLINDYADTAAFLKNMDLLVTIDTSIAHLAGAMGIKTFLLLPYDAEWRWFYDEDKTDWYDSIKIFKQSNPKDWESVISRVKSELEKL